MVKQLKKDGAGADALEPEVAKLVALRAELDAARKTQQADGDKDGGAAFNRAGAFASRVFQVHQRRTGVRRSCLGLTRGQLISSLSFVSSRRTQRHTHAAFDDLLKRKMFVVSAFEIHGGAGGLFDLGPPSCALKVSFG